MSPSPRNSEGKARALRELSRELSHSPRSLPSPTPVASQSNPTLHTHDFTASSLWDPEHEAIMSTRQLEEETTDPLPRSNLRSTAKKFAYYNPPMSDLPVNTSMVNKEFQDFDHSISDDESMSIEQGRGDNRSARGTPGRWNSSFVMNDSLYDMTPPKASTRKPVATEGSSLRRDAQIRRASGVPSKDSEARVSRLVSGSVRNSPAPGPNQNRRRSTLTDMHHKIAAEEDTFNQHDRPPTVTFPNKSHTRFNNRGSRGNSPQLDGAVETPPRASYSTPRAAPMTANATAQSFMLPDLPNLTELVSGVFQDGTPVFSRNAPPRSRLGNMRGAARGQPHHVPIDSVPIPSDEKAIFAALQLLKEKVAQLEHERAESEKKIDEQENEIIELRAASVAQENLRRSDSALGSTDGEGSGGKGSWKVEKTRLETSVETLRTRLDRTERKLSVAEISNKRITSERDNLVSQLSVAFYNSEELKNEKGALQVENDSLRKEIEVLRAENEDMRERLSQEQSHFREETQQLRRRMERTETAVHKDNETLRAELGRIRTQHDEETQQWARKEVELRKAKKDQAEYAKLKAEHDDLKAQLAQVKTRREEEAQRWATREQELKKKVDRRDDTIRHFQEMTQEETNEAVRIDNENLRAELAQMNAQYEQDNQQWSKREAQLWRKIENRQDAVRKMEDMTREILGTRAANDQQMWSAGAPIENKENEGARSKANAGIQRKSSQPREDTRARIATQIQQAIRNSRSVSAAHPASHLQTSPRKSSSRFQFSPHHPSRSVSAPIQQRHPNVESDVESTTDLSLAVRNANTPYVMRGGMSGMPRSVEAPAPLDLTELSIIRPDYIAEIRRQLEEERVGNRASSAPSERQTREDTVRSVASTKSRQQSLPRRSSMKDVTGKTNHTVFEDLTGNVTNHSRNEVAADHTQTRQTVDTSVLSQSSRRRRSAPVEMTSAFILPDITVHPRKQATLSIPSHINIPNHDNDNCTVCRRISPTVTNPLEVPTLIPVSARMPDDVDATLRPSRSPKDALALVVKELDDELAHLKLELAAHEALLRMQDASLGRRKRKAIEEAMQNLLNLISVKSDQVYHLYDVLEGQQADRLTEAEVEELTREIRTEEEEARKEGEKGMGKGKKVTVESHRDSEEESEDEEDELPWEGFEDTGSLNLRALDRRLNGVC